MTAGKDDFYMNPMFLMQIKDRMNTFNAEHPKLGRFFSVIKSNAIKEGTIIEMKVTTPEGEEYVSNIKLTNNDVETIRMMSSMENMP